MIGYLYILKTKGDHYYIGSTNNIERRLVVHRNGKTKSLRKLLPFELVFSKKIVDIATARRLEYKLKRFKNKNIIKRIIDEQNIEILV